MTKMIIGVFSDNNHAEKAILKLESKHYNPKDISIITREQDKGKNIIKKAGADLSGSVFSGVATGGAIGALAGFLVGTGIIPGIGAIFIGGPLAAALGLAGTAASTISGATTGVLVGGIIGILGGLGIAGKDAITYEEKIKQGGVLIAVPTYSDNEDEIRSILREHGADKIRAIDYGEFERYPATA